jgi:hypothetical protein
VDKLFNADGQTATEMGSNADPDFIKRWKDRNDNKVVNRFKPVAGAPAVTTASAGPSAPSTTKPLFQD